MTFQRHISQAQAAAMVNGPEVLVAIVRADRTQNAGRRLELLQAALKDAGEIVTAIQVAIDKEMQPVTPVIAAERIRSIADGSAT